MTIYYNRARGRWVYDFRRGGQRFAGYADDLETREPATSRRKAESIEALLKAQADAALKAEAKAQARDLLNPVGFTLAQAMAYYAEHRGKTRRTWEDGIKRKIRELLDWFGPATVVEKLTVARVREYIAWSRDQDVRRYMGGPLQGGDARSLGRKRAARTVNGYLVTLRAALNLCLEDEKVTRIPHIPTEDEPADEPNPIQRADLDRILAVAPDHLRDVLMLCVMTGMRQDECVLLTWRQVDLERGIVTLVAAETKSNRGRPVFLNPVATGILDRLYAARPLPRTLDQRVILYRPNGNGRPRPIASVKKAWETALEKVGLKEPGVKARYRFHDTRAAFCSYLAEQGVDPVHIKELAGHKDITTTMRYVKASNTRLREAVNRLDFGRPVPDLQAAE